MAISSRFTVPADPGHHLGGGQDKSGKDSGPRTHGGINEEGEGAGSDSSARHGATRRVARATGHIGRRDQCPVSQRMRGKSYLLLTDAYSLGATNLNPILNSNPDPDPIFKSNPNPDPILKSNPNPDPILNSNPHPDPILNSNPYPDRDSNHNPDLNPIFIPNINTNPNRNPLPHALCQTYGRLRSSEWQNGLWEGKRSTTRKNNNLDRNGKIEKASYYSLN